jgi:hypothetical protein
VAACRDLTADLPDNSRSFLLDVNQLGPRRPQRGNQFSARIDHDSLPLELSK